MDGAYYRLLSQPIFPRHSEAGPVPALGAHPFLRGEDCQWPRGHTDPRCGGVRSRLRLAWDVARELDISAHDPLNVQVSKARPGENLSGGIAPAFIAWQFCAVPSSR